MCKNIFPVDPIGFYQSLTGDSSNACRQLKGIGSLLTIKSETLNTLVDWERNDCYLYG